MAYWSSYYNAYRRELRYREKQKNKGINKQINKSIIQNSNVHAKKITDPEQLEQQIKELRNKAFKEANKLTKEYILQNANDYIFQYFYKDVYQDNENEQQNDQKYRELQIRLPLNKKFTIFENIHQRQSRLGVELQSIFQSYSKLIENIKKQYNMQPKGDFKYSRVNKYNSNKVRQNYH